MVEILLFITNANPLPILESLLPMSVGVVKCFLIQEEEWIMIITQLHIGMDIRVNLMPLILIAANNIVIQRRRFTSA
jgi:hypothetical protein